MQQLEIVFKARGSGGLWTFAFKAGATMMMMMMMKFFCSKSTIVAVVRKTAAQWAVSTGIWSPLNDDPKCVRGICFVQPQSGRTYIIV